MNIEHITILPTAFLGVGCGAANIVIPNDVRNVYTLTLSLIVVKGKKTVR